MIEIKKDTIIGDILDVAPQTAPIFFSIGMHCLGCPSSRGETVEEACAVHGVDVDKLLELVNQEANKAACLLYTSLRLLKERSWPVTVTAAPGDRGHSSSSGWGTITGRQSSCPESRGTDSRNREKLWLWLTWDGCGWVRTCPHRRTWLKFCSIFGHLVG